MKPVFKKMQKRRVASIITLVCIFTMLTSMVSFGINDYTTSNNSYVSLSQSESRNVPAEDSKDFSPRNGNGLARENGTLYFYKNGNKCVDGWIKDGKLLYFADPDGKLYNDVKKTIDGNEYIFDRSGIMYKDIFKFKGEAYYAGNNGVIRKNSWINFNGNRYLANADGVLYSNTIINIDGNNYAFDTYGRLYTGIFFNGDKKYISRENGILKVSEWSEIDGCKYYSKSDGTLAANESLEIDNVSYSFSKDGKLIVANWINSEDGYSYYMGNDGSLYKNGVFNIDNKLYGFDTKGRKLVGLFNINSEKYYADKNGVIIKNSWNLVDGKYYYSNNDGKLMKNGIHNINNTDYAFNNDGSAISGLFTHDNKQYIASEKGEVLKNGIKKYNGKSYYASTDGHIFKNTLITFGPPKYFAKEDGTLACNETIRYGGRTYKFDSNCEIVIDYSLHERIIEAARNEIGTKTGKKYWDNLFNGSPGYVNGDSTPWCACFVKWCFDKIGEGSRISGVKNKAYVPSYRAWGLSNGLWTNTPSPGDIIIFRYSPSSSGSHIGFVESVNGNSITTVEGNTGRSNHGEVKRNTYNINSSYIFGFIHY